MKNSEWHADVERVLTSYADGLEAAHRYPCVTHRDIGCARCRAVYPPEFRHIKREVDDLRKLIAEAGAEYEALRKDAERWRALCNLWLMCTILTLTQDEDGRWSIEATEPVDSETFATLTGDDPDSAIDAALTGRE